MDKIYKIKKENPEKLVAIENVNYSLVDCAFFSVQKGFGMPSGLRVIIANEMNSKGIIKIRKETEDKSRLI